MSLHLADLLFGDIPNIIGLLEIAVRSKSQTSPHQWTNSKSIHSYEHEFYELFYLCMSIVLIFLKMML
mgnify:CR=1 FL=1